MCEIHFLMPIQSRLESLDMEQITALLKKGAEKNKDGFGLFDEAHILRRPCAYSDKFNSLLAKRFKDSVFIVAHNRLATHGNVKKKNTHPFASGQLVWVHNGMIFNYEEIATEYKLGRVLVDSEVIGKAIEKELANRDIVSAIKQVAEKLKGSYSVFVWHKPSQRLLYFRHDADFYFRLYKRQGKKVIVGSSVKDNLQGLYSQSLYGFDVPTSQRLAVKEPEAGTIYELDKAQGLRALQTFKPREFAGYGYYQGFSPECLSDSIEVKKLGAGTYKLIAEEQVLKQLRDYFGPLFLDKQKAIVDSGGLEELMEMLY
ncbi:class II glutamine amidotransferase [Candidatus Acetothermia bacterium]|nr:class II glutamine amidotransferase [Candidatus Acetothermia bacterium]